MPKTIHNGYLRRLTLVRFEFMLAIFKKEIKNIM